jgi:hypothetical protein
MSRTSEREAFSVRIRSSSVKLILNAVLIKIYWPKKTRIARGAVGHNKSNRYSLPLCGQKNAVKAGYKNVSELR